MLVQPYLTFGGRCQEAVDFYRDVLGAEVQMMMRFKEAPESPPPGVVPDNWGDKVMHACLKIGDTWVHLRLCMTCGHVGCCDSSKNKHATKHFHMTKHPIIKSFQPGEEWGWCYIDEEMFDEL